MSWAVAASIPILSVAEPCTRCKWKGASLCGLLYSQCHLFAEPLFPFAAQVWDCDYIQPR
jgi:hypothetical protein